VPLALALSLLVALAATVRAATVISDPPAFLRTQFGFADADLAALAQGRPVARVIDSGDHSEVLAVAAVRVSTTMDRVRQQLETFEGRRRPIDVLQAGRLGPVPSAADLAALTIDAGDLAALPKCRPGDCDVRLPADVIERFRREVDWSSPTRVSRATALWHEVLAGLGAAYLEKGDDALFEYDNNDMPVKVGESLARVIARSGFLAECAPDLFPYLMRFPADRPSRVTDYVYWMKEKFWIKAVVSLNHVSIVSGDGPAGPYLLAAAKQIYANRYFESSLSVTAYVQGAPASYLVYVSRSRADIRRGGFNFLERMLIRRLVEARLDAQLKWMRDVLQGAARAEGDPQDRAARSRAAGAAGTAPARGIVNENVLPRPGVLVAQMRPPCASTIPLAMASPRPAPRRAVWRACQ